MSGGSSWTYQEGNLLFDSLYIVLGYHLSLRVFSRERERGGGQGEWRERKRGGGIKWKKREKVYIEGMNNMVREWETEG